MSEPYSTTHCAYTGCNAPLDAYREHDQKHCSRSCAYWAKKERRGVVPTRIPEWCERKK